MLFYYMFSSVINLFFLAFCMDSFYVCKIGIKLVTKSNHDWVVQHTVLLLLSHLADKSQLPSWKGSRRILPRNMLVEKLQLLRPTVLTENLGFFLDSNLCKLSCCPPVLVITDFGSSLVSQVKTEGADAILCGPSRGD